MADEEGAHRRATLAGVHRADWLEAVARFLASEEPADLHAAVRQYGAIVLAVPGVQAKLREWRHDITSARHWGVPDSDSEVQRAHEGLRGIGKALLPPRGSGRPRKRAIRGGELVEAYEQLHRSLKAARRDWRACPTQPPEAVLHRHGLGGLVGRRDLDPLRDRPREVAMRVLAWNSKLPLRQVRKAVTPRGKLHKKSVQKP